MFRVAKGVDGAFSSAIRGGRCAIDFAIGRTLYRVDEIEALSLVKTPERLIAYAQKNGVVYLLEAGDVKCAIIRAVPRHLRRRFSLGAPRHRQRSAL